MTLPPPSSQVLYNQQLIYHESARFPGYFRTKLPLENSSPRRRSRFPWVFSPIPKGAVELLIQHRFRSVHEGAFVQKFKSPLGEIDCFGTASVHRFARFSFSSLISFGSLVPNRTASLRTSSSRARIMLHIQNDLQGTEWFVDPASTATIDPSAAVAMRIFRGSCPFGSPVRHWADRTCRRLRPSAARFTFGVRCCHDW